MRTDHLDLAAPPDPGTTVAVAALETRFGDPWDDANPLGFAACLAADERAELVPAGERVLDEYGLGAEFVPTRHGGRLSRMDRLIEVMRAVYRRDPCLGLGYGASTLMAAVNVWTSGSARQQADVAQLLLGNGKLACAYHELAHGNDLSRAELAATGRGDRLVLNGRKEVVANIDRAAAMVVFARTGPAGSGRGHSQLLLRRADLPAGSVRDLPRFHTVGMRGVPLGGIEFLDCPVGTDTVLGAPGRGLETALRSFQLTRIALPGMVVGILDTALRISVRYARGRRLYGAPVAEMSRSRAVLADAFADLLVCDAFCAIAARAVHLLPTQAVLYASAVKYLVPKLVIAAVTRLSDLLGASFYLRDGEFGMLQKLMRDVAPSSFGHAGALPGSFKNLLDWTVGGGELYGKPVAWINAAAPGRGEQARASLATVLGYVGAAVIDSACARVPVPREAVGPDGTVSDPTVRAAIAGVLTAIGDHVGPGG
jgi:alkylation response protein AidB-like acyl-CoA dehydrogenase